MRQLKIQKLDLKVTKGETRKGNYNFPLTWKQFTYRKTY